MVFIDWVWSLFFGFWGFVVCGFLFSCSLMFLPYKCFRIFCGFLGLDVFVVRRSVFGDFWFVFLLFWKNLKGFLRIFLWIGLVFSSGSNEVFGPFEAVCWCECVYLVWFGLLWI